MTYFTARAERSIRRSVRDQFLDVISNARPGYAHNLASVSNEVYMAAIGSDLPTSYSDLVSAMPPSQVAVVYGEEDNTFTPVRSLPIVFEQQGFAGVRSRGDRASNRATPAVVFREADRDVQH